MKNLTTVLAALLLCTSLLAQICPDPGATRKRVASSFHSTVMIDYTGDVKYWGDGANPATPAFSPSSILTPTTLSTGLYSGTPLAVAAGSVGAGTDSGYAHQLYLLTSTGLYGWGATNGTITAIVYGSTPIVSIPLPSGVAIGDVNFIASSGGGLAIITKIVGGAGGSVYIKNGRASGGSSVYTYGDGATATFDQNWHRVATTQGSLTGVVRLSYSQKAVMALTSTGRVFAWGEQVWAGNPLSVGNRPFATEVTLPVSGSDPVVPADINVITRTDYTATCSSATQFVLGVNGKLYGIGEGNLGILGQGDEIDATEWVTVKGPSGGTTELSGIIQISSNNSYVAATAYYSIGALSSDGELFLWGQNSNYILGTITAFFSLPRIPPNFSVNQARVGFFHMGGHTTIAFLSGTNRFCYLGHLIRGSMGDGTVGTANKIAFDCINTPNAYVCPPPPALGCAAPSSNDLVASSNHATLVINGQPSVTYWGQGSSSAEPGVSVLLPRLLYEYNGTPVGVAASAVNETMGATQMWILTTAGLWGWGYSANTIDEGMPGVIGLTAVALPVPINNVSFIRSSRGGIALVTKDSMVWIKAGPGSACTSEAYGDNTVAAANSNWHQVTTTNGGILTGVSELSFGGTGAIAISSSGVYTWGINTYLGDGTTMATRRRATLMTLHSDFSGSVVPKTAEIIQSGTNGAAEFILGSNGKVYSLGSNLDGVTGQGGGGELRSWAPIVGLTTVRKLSSNNPFANGFYSIGALTLNGTVFLWGNNNAGMLGGGGTVSYNVPTIPSGIGAGIVANFEMGGHQTIVFPKSSNKFYFAGHSIAGSMGDSSAAANVTAFIPGAEVVNCAGLVYDISGFVLNDANGTSNGLVDGAGMNMLNAAPLYVNLLDASGYVIGTSAIDEATGGYVFTDFPSGNYTVQVSTVMGILFSPAPAWSLPPGWSFAGDQLGNSASTGMDTSSDGRLNIVLTGTVTNARIGFNRNPVAGTVTNVSSIVAPVGSNTFIVPALRGSDPEDQPAMSSLAGKTVFIRTLPTNGRLYYNGVAATVGMSIPGYDVNLLTLDPDNRVSQLAFSFEYADASGIHSDPAAVTLNVSYVSASGNISSDQNGLNDAGGGLVNGSPIYLIGETPLYVSMVDTSGAGTILATVQVQEDGSYRFTGIVPSGSLQLVLHIIPGTQSSGGSLVPVLPAGWGYAGEQSGTSPGAGILPPVNGIAEINVTTVDLTNIRFAVEQQPGAEAKAYQVDLFLNGLTIVLNGSLGGTLAAPDQLTGSDPEDAPASAGLNGNSGNRTIVIRTLPANGQLSYNEVLVTAGQVINNYNKNLLTLNLSGAGYNSTSFTYSFLDAASVSSVPATYSISWNMALPVLLASFKLAGEEGKVRLDWVTTAEQNNRGFDIERSGDARSWHKVGFVATKANGGTTNEKLSYLYYDESPWPGINHYRLKQTDFDDHFTYSDIKSIALNGSGKLGAMPNPVIGRLTITGLNVGNRLQITDGKGNILKQKKAMAATETMEMNELPAGMYILQVLGNNEVLKSIKLVKK